MVFPSLVFNVEPGLASQFSAGLVLAVSFMIHRMKKVWILALLMLGGIAAFSYSHAVVAVMPQSYPQFGGYPPQMNNFFNYYGTPWGYSPPVYFYPQLQYPMMMPIQQPYYFNPHPPSPYNPGYYCPTCNLPNPQPVFPVIHPNGMAS